MPRRVVARRGIAIYVGVMWPGARWWLDVVLFTTWATILLVMFT